MKSDSFPRTPEPAAGLPGKPPTGAPGLAPAPAQDAKELQPGRCPGGMA